MGKYKHLSLKEREEIYDLYQSGINKKRIGTILGRHSATIGREITRNKVMIGVKHNNDPNTKKLKQNYHYLPDRAQKKYMFRRKTSKQKCDLKSIVLYKYTLEKLKLGWTPRLISGRAKFKQIGQISHECIYQFIFSRRGWQLKLYEYLPRSGRYRRKKRGRKAKRILIPNRIGIEKRPVEVETRKEFGHWETDSVLGVGKGAALNTNRERKSRYMIVTKIGRKTAENTKSAIIKRFKKIPIEGRLTNTADNGPEFTQHEKVTKKIGMKFYFANPYSSWERGTNENGNGLIRRFFPKKTDFNKVSNAQIKAVEDWINHRPMVCLGFKTPHEVFHKELALCQNSENCT